MSDLDNGGGSASPEIGAKIPEFVDWIVATTVALAGVVLTVGGSVLTFVADRDLIEAGVEPSRITVFIFERDLTEAEVLELSMEVVVWTGWGLLMTGIGLVLFAIGYVISRHRAYQRASNTEAASSYQSHTVLGAVITGILSFLPFSPVIGGGAAGYLERSTSGRIVSVGALSGLFAMVPFLVILVFVTIGVYAGLAAVRSSDLGIVTTAAMLGSMLFIAAYGAGLGALGGFAGGRVAER